MVLKEPGDLMVTSSRTVPYSTRRYSVGTVRDDVVSTDNHPPGLNHSEMRTQRAQPLLLSTTLTFSQLSKVLSIFNLGLCNIII